jgi:HK97 family phage prohead protease
MPTRTILLDDLDERARKEAAASRRFPVSISSESPVPRRDWQTGEMFDEILSHARGAVNLARAPLPVLEGHDRSKVNVGIVTNLKLDGGRLRGELVLGASQRAAELAEDVASGVVTGISIGYMIDVEERDEAKKRITARKWTPYEVSFTPVPADVTVGIGRSRMPAPLDTSRPTPAPSPAHREEIAPDENRAALAERERITTILDLAERHGLGDAFADDLITRGVPLDDARTRMLEALVTRSDASPHDSHTHFRDEGNFEALGGRVTAGDDYREDFHRAAIDSLLLRSGIRVEKPHAAARDLSGSLHDLARICLSRMGRSGSRARVFGESSGQALIRRAMTVADFTGILSGAVGAAIRNGYESEPSSHRQWVRVVPVADFHQQERPILGSAPSLETVSEHAEYTVGYLTDDLATYTIGTSGRIVSISWQSMTNDRFGAFLRIQPAMGMAARRAEADAVCGLFSLNSGAGPTMQDSVALWHSTHSNLVSSATFDAAQLALGRTALRKMQALNGGYMALVPRYLIVPPEKESTAEVLIANASRPAAGADKTVAQWIASLGLVVEPRLAATGVFLVADSAQIDSCELGVLDDNIGGPTVEENAEFVKDVLSWKVRHSFQAKWLDWRSSIKMIVT